MEIIHIKKVSLLEINILEDISKRSFIETYASKNTAKNMEAYLTDNFSPSQLKKQINDPGSEFYIASINDDAIGYLKINFGSAQTEFKTDNFIEIERIYVLNDFQGKKIGQLLCNKAFQIGQQKKADLLWLGVWEENQKAIRFYKKYGFAEFDKHIFKLGNDDQTDLLMKLKL
ncbi:MAG: GNAT family N-acetyltransferase [Bacteroidia bacterium]